MKTIKKQSALVPWSVDIVSAVPASIVRSSEEGEPKKKKKRVTSALDSTFNAGAVCPGWVCLGSSKGAVYVWRTAENSLGSIAVSPSKKKAVIDAPKGCLTLFHPSLLPPSGNLEDASSSPLLVALAPGAYDSVFVYACQPANDSIFVWKVTKEEAQKAAMVPQTINSYANAALPLERREDDEEEDLDQPDEFVTSLSVVDRHMIVLGTSNGGMICCAQSTVPVALHAQRLIPGNSKSRKSFSAYLFSSSSNDTKSYKDGSPVVFTLPMTATTGSDDDEEMTDLLAVTQMGTIFHWEIKPTVAKNHRVTSDAFRVTSLLTLLQENLSPSITNLTGVEPLQAKLHENRLHFIVRTNSGGDCRLFWVRLRPSRNGTKVKIDWVDAQWLNRFPAPQDVEVKGLVLSTDKDEMAYSAFHQRSGGVTSSVIVMALSDADEGDEPSTTVFEVDLPLEEVPALLPDTFTNDIETHGCCVFARSGLGIRVRVFPPETEAPLSPRAAARANPSAVMKLANHLRSAFWEAYQHQDMGSLALPPSLVEANPVDLEEAVIAAASQLHEQRSGDTAGWTSISFNGLERHLALIQWLRHGGLYRSLTTYGKWRLLSLGQEVAAFLELVTPTMSPRSSDWEKQQFSDLSLARGIDVWLKEKLEAVIREGSIDQYQLWCGWFSTALATATTYREDYATSKYDITQLEYPPVIGETGEGDTTTRVPWTSRPVLQDCFDMLLQHWHHHPQQKNVQMLPPQTVEVISKAALDSYSDSATSLGSERAAGKYAEIKTMTIPLLRALHPRPRPSRRGDRSDDQLAFNLSVRHNYFAGICEIAHDHENRPDCDNFRLEPLLQSTTQCQDIDFQTGQTFAQFVLHWHASRGLYGHAIAYGRLCPERDLNHILQSDEKLRSHRWIQNIYNGNYDAATTSLMSRAEEKTSTMALSETKWSFCMAKLANQVMKETPSKEAQAEARRKKIESKLELVGVQEELLPVENRGLFKSQTEHLWSPKNLLSLALEKAEQAATEGATEKATRCCYLGLLICTTFEDQATQNSHTVQVWAKSIAVDWSTQWTEWIRTENDLSRDALAYNVLDSTVFGGLLKECGDDSSLEDVTFSSQMEYEVIEQMGLTGGAVIDSFRRLLFSTLKVFQSAPTADEDMEDALDI